MPTVSQKLKCIVQEIQVRISNLDLWNFAIKEAKVDPNKVYPFDERFDIESNDDDSITITIKIKEEDITGLANTGAMELCTCDPKPYGQQFQASPICTQCNLAIHHYVQGKLQPCCRPNGACCSPKNLGRECEKCGSEYHEIEHHREP